MTDATRSRRASGPELEDSPPKEVRVGATEADLEFLQATETESARFWSFLHGSRFHFSSGQVVLLLLGAMALGAVLGPMVTQGGVGGEGVATLIGMIIVVGEILRRTYVKQTAD